MSVIVCTGLGLDSRVQLPAGMMKVELGGWSIAYSNKFEVRQSVSRIEIFSGRCLSAQGKFKFDGIELNKIDDVLSGLSGPFFYLNIQADCLVVGVSLCRYEDFFISEGKAGFLMSTSIAHLVSSATEMDLDYCRSYLIGNELFGGCTPFKGIEKVTLGSLFKFVNGAVEKKLIALDMDKKSTAPPIGKLLADNIEILRDEGDIYLNFSGGLDSSMVCASMVKRGIIFTPVHSVPLDLERSSEVYIAREFCELLGVELSEQVYCSSVRLAEVSGNVPNLVHDIGFLVSDNGLEVAPSGTYISGNGGDSVFLQNPPKLVATELMRRLSIRRAFRALMELAILKRHSFPKLLMVNIASLFHVKVSPIHTSRRPKWLIPHHFRRREHPLLSRFAKNSSKYFHALNILESMYFFKQGRGISGTKEFEPILFQNVVGVALSMPCEKMYNRVLDRVWIRKELASMYPAKICDRSQKRSAAPLYFDSVQKNELLLMEILLGGMVVRNLNINRDLLKSSICTNGSVGLNDDMAYIERLFRLEIYYRHFPISKIKDWA